MLIIYNKHAKLILLFNFIYEKFYSCVKVNLKKFLWVYIIKKKYVNILHDFFNRKNEKKCIKYWPQKKSN